MSVPLNMSPVNRDPFERIFSDLKSKNDDSRRKAAQELRLTLDALQKGLSSHSTTSMRTTLLTDSSELASTPSEFNNIYNAILQRISQYATASQPNETAERVGGIYALDALVDLKADELGQKHVRYTNILRTVMSGNDMTAMVVAARALGRLTQPGHPLIAELVDSEVRVALESLQVTRQENRRFAAVLTLRELAESSPTLLYPYVSQILEVIWVALRDEKVMIREKTAEAVSAIFKIIVARDAKVADDWFVRVYNEISKGFQMGAVETIHGSLLALKALILEGGMFMQSTSRYEDACNKIFLYKDHREPLIRSQVTMIIPILARYNPPEFSHLYLHKFMMHLQGQLKRERDRNPAFVAIGQVANAIGSAIEPYLDGILVYVREGLSFKAYVPYFPLVSLILLQYPNETDRRNKSSNDAPIFKCISMIAIAVGQTLTKYMDALLDPIFACGLSEALTQALVDMAHYIPPAKQTIQEKLLDLLSHVLSGRPFSPLGSPSHNTITTSFVRDLKNPQYNEQKEAEIVLALQTLGSFDFSGYHLNEFVRDVVIRYVEDENPNIRKASALTCCQLFIKDPCVKQVSRHAIQVVSTVIERLLAVAVADQNPEIRRVVLESLHPRFDKHLAKAENVRSLFLALNDEVFANREAAMTIIGRLTSVNPAYVFPSLRKVLIQLLTEIEYSNSPRTKQESARLISHLVNSSEKLIQPYVDPMIHVLLPRVSDQDSNVAAMSLRAIGDLAVVGGEDMVKYIPDLTRLIIGNLQDLGSTTKRSAALKAMGQVASNSGYVIQPYIDYPELLTILMNIVKTESPGDLRRETIRLIGILGALDPYRHQLVVEQSPEHTLAIEAQSVNDVSLIITGLKPSSEDYYPTVVVNTLTNLAKDPTMTQYHSNILDAIMSIYQTMSTKCVGYLGQVIPAFLHIINSAGAGRAEGYFFQLCQLVRIVHKNIRPFLESILNTVQVFWTIRKEYYSTMCALVESIARSLEGDFKIYLARVLPIMLGVLEDDKASNRNATKRVLRAFLVFGSSAEEYMHLIIPVVIKLFDKPTQPQFLRKLAMETLGKISRKVNISEYATRIIQPLCRVLAGSDGVLRQTALDTLCALIFQLGPDYVHFIPTVNKVLVTNKVPHGNYSAIVAKLQKGEPLPQNLSPDEHYGEDEDDLKPAEIAHKQLAVNQEHLRAAWETSQRSTREDWYEWIRRLSIELLKESPQHALRACFPLASVHPPTARALFNSAFISCYTLLYPEFQKQLISSIEWALTSSTIPAEILQQLLNLAEFMEHDDKPLPIDVRTLGREAGRCQAFAKALHYKELEFNTDKSPSSVEALISINNQLQQSDAAFGILRSVQTSHELEIKETWFEKLNRWEEALASYQRRESEDRYDFEVIHGKMRCLHALGEWDVLSTFAEDKWVRASTEGHQRRMAPLAAAAAWGLERWELVDKYIGAIKEETPDRSFFGAILSIQRNQFEDAHVFIEKARDSLDTELSAVLGESYNRAYNVVVRIQMLAELEEIVSYKQNAHMPARQALMRQTWNKRLKGCQRNVETWQRMLKVRALVVKPKDNVEMLIKFANLCRKSQRFGLADQTLRKLVPKKTDLFATPLEEGAPYPVRYAVLKCMWSSPGGHQEKALGQLREFTGQLSEAIQIASRDVNAASQQYEGGINGVNGTTSFEGHGLMNGMSGVNGFQPEHPTSKQLDEWQRLLARCHLKQAQWRTTMQRGDWHHDHVQEVLASYAAATRFDPSWYKAWHAWALANFEVVTHLTNRSDRESADVAPTIILDHVVPAIRGFLKSIALSSTSSLQDTLRFLTLWFAHGSHQEVNTAIAEGLSTVSIDTWLEVIPQLIARINQPSPRTRQLIHNLLCEVGRAHPQALVYPLTVSIKSDTARRSRAAQQIMENLRQHSPRLAEQADLVSQELIRIAVLWHEQWHEGLEEASRLYFGEKNVQGMLEVLQPLHEMIEKTPQTLREVSFIQTFGRDLHDAKEWCNTFQRSNDDGDLNSAWDVYYQVFKKIAKHIQGITSLDLQYVSPALKNASNLDLAVPGTYQSGKQIIRINSFETTAGVIQSKQRPRKLSLRGSDGVAYAFVLKGHEDIRQDERVMQLFGLVNTLLANDPECLKRHLNIQRYAAIPLSTQSGLLGWVPNSDTLHQLIKEYRENRSILLNIEHRIMLQMAPDYELLSLMQKVEVFSYAMDNTTGQDLYRVLWLKSKSSEAWLDRRTNYIRSLAVMSMVGYILGLGDRHPSNLLLDRITGKVVHIDFGDCFEVAMHREKYPERVPFRLTRMLTYAMEVSNIEGSFRTTCENVMRVLRDNKESLMAVLEAFIHDPLLTWRLNTRDSPAEPSFRSERRASIMGLAPGETGTSSESTMHPAATGSLSGRPRHRSSTAGGSARPTNLTNSNATTTSMGGGNAVHGVRGSIAGDGAPEPQNARALQVLSRVKEKLTGRDFKPNEELNVETQVSKLINEATSLENLCQHYIGWCSFW